jgi:hypothetical protein
MPECRCGVSFLDADALPCFLTQEIQAGGLERKVPRNFCFLFIPWSKNIFRKYFEIYVYKKLWIFISLIISPAVTFQQLKRIGAKSAGHSSVLSLQWLHSDRHHAQHDVKRLGML